ncbi:AbrB family transcriptional regulator [Afifella sp. IM 167]|uniref:AbrB family transcriptional regulator n=1 Tax=Afifella sp. IM 167 TaxID=2033586 RepID=UPI001CCA28CA|nr:AbrB family transcriptional regulator [Afifella sp. IM 167]MBZ8133337.1 ammonia monooxygenase [Afifella sp. IM 167]
MPDPGADGRKWRRFGPASWPAGLRWPALLALSLLLLTVLETLHLPAALLLGPMLAAILLAASGGVVRVPPSAFIGAQGVLGFMIAGILPATIFREVASDWPVFVAGTLSTVVLAALLGWVLTRARLLPGTTAVWGSAPGAAAVMTVMSEDYGADMRLVAFMQYLRVACCAVVATIAGRLVGVPGGAVAPVEWFPAIPWPAFLATLACALGSAWIGFRLRLPGGALLLPLCLGLFLELSGTLTIFLPPWLLAITYAGLGWAIGMRFTPAVLAHAAHIFPQVLASTLALIALCGGLAGLLVLFADIDPLTAYLATTPGGADSVAIIAAATNVDAAFVMAMQVARFFVVLLVGPSLARLMSRGAAPGPGA